MCYLSLLHNFANTFIDQIVIILVKSSIRNYWKNKAVINLLTSNSLLTTVYQN